MHMTTGRMWSVVLLAAASLVALSTGCDFFGGCLDDDGCWIPACSAGQMKCGDYCTNLEFDPNNCGACGVKCESGVPCNQGKCYDCGTLLTKCAGVCVDTQSDRNNCGTCGTRCDTENFSFCIAGACACATGYTSCSGKCVNMANDPNNCGTCGTSCGDGTPCSSGKCLECPGLMVCSGSCIDLQTDEKNCGVCGKQCSSGEGCFGGVCILPVLALQISCPHSTLPSGSSMQCSYMASGPSGVPVALPVGTLMWSAVNHSACAGAAGAISNGPPSAQPIGTFTAMTAGCMSEVSASYTAGGAPVKSNVLTVTVTN